MRLDVKAIAKGVLEGSNAYRYHRRHAANAAAALRSIESDRGKTSPSLIGMADEYARVVLGHEHYSPWLRVYAALSGGFREGWIPDNYYGQVVVPRIQGPYGAASHLKLLANIMFGSEAFPDLAYSVNGLLMARDHSTFGRREAKTVLFKDSEKIVFKVDDSKQGRGIFFFSSDDFDIDEVLALGNGVFQSCVIQHESLDQFAANSVATLRITTAVDDEGDIAVRASYLRLGRARDTHVQSRTHIRIPVDLATGALAREGYLANWHAVEEHPDSQVRFLGQRIPAFRRCVSTVLELHRKVPFTRCVGWDVAVAADQSVRIMEWNAEHNDIKFSEATQGPCFADLGWEKLWRAPARDAALPGASQQHAPLGATRPAHR